MWLGGKKVFLAGSTGMVGTAILKYLLKNFPDVSIRAGYFKHTAPIIKDERIEYISADLRILKECHQAVQSCDAAIMAAAVTTSAASINTNPLKIVNDNIAINICLLQALVEENVERIVCIGSGTAYQEHNGKIKEEDMDFCQDPSSAYFGFGWATRFIEKMAELVHRKYDRQVIIVRASNVFGPYAKFDPKRSNFIPALIRKAVHKEDPLEVWGSPEVTRDVIYCEDFSEAIIKMLDNDKVKFGVYNIGSDQATTVGEVVSWVLKYSGYSPKVIYNSSGPTTTFYRVLDCSKVKEDFGWQPRYSIEEGIKNTMEWWQENKGRWQK